MVWQRAVVCRGRGARDAKPAGRQEGAKWATPRPLGALICKCCGILEVSHLTGSQLLWTPVLTFVESPALFAESLCSRSLAQGLVFCCACETMSQAYCCGTGTAPSMLSRFVVLLLGMVSHPSIFVLLVLSSLQMVGATCPNCHGSFTSCDYDTSNVCVGIPAVAANVASVVAGTGALTLKGIIKPRFMRILSQISTEAILSLSTRPEPGTPFVIDRMTSGMKILGAINMGQITYDFAVASIMHLIDEVDVTVASATARIAKYRGMMESLKGKANQRGDEPADTGVFNYLWAKISEFVMKREAGAKLLLDSVTSASSSVTQMAATLHHPKTMEDFSEMMNLFIMMASALGLVSALVIADYFQHVVYDVMRVHKRTWQHAHELHLIMLRSIEDSGGRLKFHTCYDEKYLNTIMEEAATNVLVFFRAVGGNPSILAGSPPPGTQQPWNKKFNTTTSRCCKIYNSGKTEHPPEMLTVDGACKFNHTCNHWISSGKFAQCKQNHPGINCTNPLACKEPVKE